MKRLWKIASCLVLAAVAAAALSCVVSTKTAYASNPTTMSFQGKVVNADGTNVTDGTYGFVFKLYTVSSGGTAIWTETNSSVTVTAGVFQVNLGSICPFFTANTCNGSTPIDFSANPNLYLGITFNSDPAGEMTPRVQLQSVPFAYQADNASKLGGLAASNYVQLSPSSQQSGNINVNGNGTFGGTLSVSTGATITGNLGVSGRVNASSTTGTNGQGYFIQNSTPNNLASFQALDLSGSTFAFFGANKYYNGSAWVDDGLSRKGSSFQIQDDMFTFYSFDTGTNFTARLAVASGGNVGVATTSPTSLFSVGTSSQFQVNGSGAIVALTGITTTGGYLQSGTTANTFTGASTFSAAGTALSVTNSATIGTGLTVTSGGATIGGNSSVTGSLAVNTGTANQLQVTSGTNVPTVDQLNITNTGSTGVTAAGINGLSIAYKGGAAAVEAAAERIDLQPGSTSGGTWDALRVVPNATGAVSGVTLNGIKLDNLTTPGAGTENALDVGTGWDNVLQSAHVIITQLGAISGVTTLTAATVNATTAYQANGTAGISVTCTGTQYLPAPVIKEGIVTGNAACAGIGLSDERVKTDIIPLDGSVLDSIKNVNPVSFYYDCSNPYFSESNTYCDPTHQTGVIAQQLMQIFPDLVSQDSYGYYHVDYQGLSAYTLKATSEIAQYLDSAGNANLTAVTADSLGVNGNTTIGGNLTVDGTTNFAGGITYSSLNTPTGDFSSSIITPALTADGALSITSGSSGDVAIDSGANSAVVNIGGGNANTVTISHSGAATEVKGALVAEGPIDAHGPVTMHFSTPSTSFTIDNDGSTQPVENAIQIADSAGVGYGKLIDSSNFNVAGDGDVTTNGAIITKGGTFQLLDPDGNQLISFDQTGSATFSGNLNLANASLTGGLTIGGDVNVAGLSTFQKLATFLAKTVFKQDVEFDGHITVSKDSAGYAVLHTGESTVHVAFTTPYTDPPIVTADLTDGQFGLTSVNNVTAQGFDLSLKDAATDDTKLSWTAVGVIDPQTAVNPTPTAQD